MEVTGRVKWFDQTRGFGFLVSEMLDGDVLVHTSRLREHGRRSVPEGAILTVEAEQLEKGMQATKVKSIDLSRAEPFKPQKKSNGAPRELTGEPGPWETVEVKWFNHATGYGFVLRDDGEEVFIHADQMHRADLDKPATGDIFEVRIAPTAKGLMVAEVRVPLGAVA